MEAIQVENVVKSYKNGVEALKGISLTVKKGEIFSLLGQNGAGKSTLINILTTYLKPTSGTIKILGNDIYTETDKARRSIACVAQKISIDTYLSLKENMIFQSRLYKMPKAEAEERMKTLISCFSLEKYLDYPVLSYSGGVKRRLDIALNLMSKPQILFLDEPTVGMDIQSRIAMWKMMKKIRDEFGTTIFLTTHYLEEADELSDTMCIMRGGKEVVQGTPARLRELIKQDTLCIRFANKNESKSCCMELSNVRKDLKIIISNEKILVYSKQSREEFKTINKWLFEKKIEFEGIEIVKPALEDVFLRLTEVNGLEEIS
ncbi:ABC-2 type transport system ATP-binding protein [Clostridium saccharoperbutylacetonicum]|uniref:Daunorubicin/doxorubicin resistance ATP-binding protein DrrA n=1 Tax=Clostridium saccharoperbutylacetonicum N1-4(HMT) TaxID=931276 RepID=M1LSA4_9CLOT|nr:ABC transporter ATP-binding protein [Clostridium saccharoperbutylacetonicum]AGF55830.1 daunorubicin/doxorubicin resistance ATP-binding protein DrrA [Clostridium saccharoperbutylacetonicum N1-4(HMT)]NRT63436.1 ABC-2 type transport system ATP-binding protein [Clostridium saccharoperbutylacetonicum]NSB26798.1 ABC-2 type transport system ATP-binding protein [Clostridium saccharoperbutylacetonicum]NSB40277.1 ABC-2 type transport system ATP-binding protein [Clostridium saccharoperbutylacetonicum]